MENPQVVDDPYLSHPGQHITPVLRWFLEPKGSDLAAEHLGMVGKRSKDDWKLIRWIVLTIIDSIN